MCALQWHVIYDYKIEIKWLRLMHWLTLVRGQNRICVDGVVYATQLHHPNEYVIFVFQIYYYYYNISFHLMCLCLHVYHFYVSCFAAMHSHSYITRAFIFPFLLSLRSVLNIKSGLRRFIWRWFKVNNEPCLPPCHAFLYVCWTHGYCFTERVNYKNKWLLCDADE